MVKQCSTHSHGIFHDSFVLPHCSGFGYAAGSYTGGSSYRLDGREENGCVPVDDKCLVRKGYKKEPMDFRARGCLTDFRDRIVVSTTPPLMAVTSRSVKASSI